MPYLAYMRPRTFPITFVFALTGYVLAPAHARGWALAADLAFLFLVYSVLGWGGSNAFNSAEDRDTGPVNLLPDPPPRPAHLGAFGLACGGAAIAVTLAWPGKLRAVPFVVLAGLLSVAYSHRGGPFRRLKEVGGLDALTHALGCGPIAIALGWTAAAPLDASFALPAVGFFLAFLGGYPTTQVFQLAPGEPYRTGRNLTSLLGAPRALRASAVAFVAHVGVLGSTIGAAVLRSAPYLLWASLVAAAAAHALAWSARPWHAPYRRMQIQLGLMMTSQVAFLVGHGAR